MKTTAKKAKKKVAEKKVRSAKLFGSTKEFEKAMNLTKKEEAEIRRRGLPEQKSDHVDIILGGLQDEKDY